ncbi:MAG TPA: 1-deoxy-D-xylulose-5-phosphate synthase N-terminal domain-containing protein [Actinomycetales bacterium]
MTTLQTSPGGPAPFTRRSYDDLPHLMTLMTGDEKHDASATSTLDALWVLYDEVLQVDLTAPDDPSRDRLLLSKGHGPMAYYAVLAAHGLLTEDELVTFGQLGSSLGHHPDRVLAAGVEISSGSLGHGLGLGYGVALGQRLAGRDARTVVLLGDAEMEEGSGWEAVQQSGRAGLGRLLAVVIDNDSSGPGWPGGLAARFALEEWTTVDVDGRDRTALAAAYRAADDDPDRPHVVIAHVEPKES